MKVNFLTIICWTLLIGCTSKNDAIVITVNGEIPASELGQTLIHEHILVDFIGADSTGYHRWDRERVVNRVLPYLIEIRARGINTLFDCTPSYIGRDPILLKILSDSSGLNIVTNTGYYGAVENKFLPGHAFTETVPQLAARWIKEWKEGLEETGIKPGFIKIGVSSDSLTTLHRKLVKAAALTHLETGLTIVSHTGLAIPAFQQIELLETEGVSPDAFVWVHAQSEKDYDQHILAARKGSWISLDGISEENIGEYILMINNLKTQGLLNRVLISHDAGWFSPDEENGGDIRGFTTISNKLVPALLDSGFSTDNIRQLLILNPVKAFTIRIRRLNDYP